MTEYISSDGARFRLASVRKIGRFEVTEIVPREELSREATLSLLGEVSAFMAHRCGESGCDHDSDCAVHNEPAMPNCACDCGHDQNC